MIQHSIIQCRNTLLCMLSHTLLYKKYAIRQVWISRNQSPLCFSTGLRNLLNIDPKNSKVITCHLGNGASACAVKNGESIDTSMGFTPVEGLIMGTRSGDIDMGAVAYIMDKEKNRHKNSVYSFQQALRIIGYYWYLIRLQGNTGQAADESTG